MAHWTEEEFVSRAKTLAQAHVGAQTPLNDLVEKVAREAELTPDAIRTLGRLTNVAVFQELFQKKASSADPDRMVEFEPGDPEVVVARVVKSAAIQDAARSELPKLASELPDLMRAERGFCAELEKVADEGPEPIERTAPRNLELMRLHKMSAELEVSAKQAAIRWEDGLAKLASAFKKAPGYGPSFVDFEKAALSEHGPAARVELAAVREDLRLPAVSHSLEKVAELSDKLAYESSTELSLIGNLIQERQQYEVLKVAHRQVSARINRGP